MLYTIVLYTSVLHISVLLNSNVLLHRSPLSLCTALPYLVGADVQYIRVIIEHLHGAC